VHFLEPGGESKIQITCGEVNLAGKYTDLSAFARDLSDWRTVRLETQDKEATIFFEGQAVYRIAYTQPIGKVKCLILNCRGAGEFDYVKVSDHQGREVYSDTFINGNL